MSAAYAQNPSARQRFRNEVTTTLHLADHPGVVTPYGIGELPELDGRETTSRGCSVTAGGRRCLVGNRAAMLSRPRQ